MRLGWLPYAGKEPQPPWYDLKDEQEGGHYLQTLHRMLPIVIVSPLCPLIMARVGHAGYERVSLCIVRDRNNDR